MLKLKRREPQEFMLWCGLLGISFTFLILTIVYIARKEGADWENFYLPKVFGISTFFMLASSFTLHHANQAFLKED
ncbi:MAG: heme-copper oxidase subunit III, partial [Bacteroidota bacterium]